MDLTALPIALRTIIPETYRDEMGHMNVMWYTHLFSEATGGLFDRIGLTRDYFETNQAGTFALEQHTRYLKEVLIGKRVTIRNRVLGRTAKRLHFMHFMVLDDGDVLAATQEAIGTHVDMTIRRTSPLPAPITAAFDQLLAEHAALDWTAPVCGIMNP